MVRNIIFHTPTITTRFCKLGTGFLNFLVCLGAGSDPWYCLKYACFFPDLSLMVLLKRMFIKKECNLFHTKLVWIAIFKFRGSTDYIRQFRSNQHVYDEYVFVNNVLKLYDCFRLDDLDIKLVHDALKELVVFIKRLW